MTDPERSEQPGEEPVGGLAEAALGPGASVHWETGDGALRSDDVARDCRRRALLLWPRLDASRLARTRGDPWRIARLVAGRTPWPLEDIVAMITRSAPACPVTPARSRRSASGSARAAAGG